MITVRRYIVVFIVALALAGCHPEGPFSGDALLYGGPGADPTCLNATTELLNGLGYGVCREGPAYFNEYGCEGFRLVVFPGGDMYQYSRDLSASTKDSIRRFLQEGGGYLGICGGSYFAASRVFWQGAEVPMTPLGLFEGSAIGPIDDIAPYPECVLTGIHLTDTDHPVTEDLEDAYRFTYCYGPYFVPDDSTPVVLYRYDIGDGAASMAFDYGAGRVFIVGLHPELTREDTGDGEPPISPQSYEFIGAALDWLLEER